jgi:L-asparaginase
MVSMQAQRASEVVVLATGGTIAGLRNAKTPGGYVAAQVDVQRLLGVYVPAGVNVVAEQVAQVDSKNMSHDIWRLLALRCAHHLARDEVMGIIITHGSDTMEETATFLHHVLAPAKPIVLTGAMRPADDPEADGPGNLQRAIAVAAHPGARGVLVLMGATVEAGYAVSKRHPWHVDAFSSGDVKPVARVEDQGRVIEEAPWPRAQALGVTHIERPAHEWPKVAILNCHAGMDASWVEAWVQTGLQGIVVATTGNGTMPDTIEAALRRAQAQGVRVLCVTRCAEGAILNESTAPLWPLSRAPTPGKARVELLLDLLGEASGD